MEVKVWRAHPYQPILIDVNKIWEDSVYWTTSISLNGNSRSSSSPIIKAQIDYSYAVKMGLASGQHSEKGKRAKAPNVQ